MDTKISPSAPVRPLDTSSRRPIVLLAAPIPNKASEAAQRAVKTDPVHSPPKSPEIASIHSHKTSQIKPKRLSLLITPMATPIHTGAKELSDIAVVYNGVRYRVTYRLKAAETLPEDFDEYCIALIQEGHEQAASDPINRAAKLELLEKPYIAEDDGTDGYFLKTADFADTDLSSLTIHIQLPARYARFRDKLEMLSLSEYQKLYGFFLQKSVHTSPPFLPKKHR